MPLLPTSHRGLLLLLLLLRSRAQEAPAHA
jgi:hypothetical protein